MRGSRNFVRGDPGQSFSQMVNFEENYHFSRFRGVQHFPGGGGSNFFQGGGGVQLLIPYRNQYNL